MPDEAGGIREFIEAAKAGGASDEFLFRLLREQGWSDRQVLDAFREHYEARTGQMLPRRASAPSARDAFLLLLSFSTLTTWIFAAGALLFSATDRMFPNPLENLADFGGRSFGASQNLASVLVAFPVFYFVTAAILRDYRRQPAKLESGIFRWLTYIALLFAAGAVIGDLVTFLAYFLRGDLTARFVSKAAIVMVFAAGVLTFYLRLLSAPAKSDPPNRPYAFAAVGICLLAVLAGFGDLGTPAGQRQAASDRQRVNDLQTIDRRIRDRGRLPDSLDLLASDGLTVRDRLTGAPYTLERRTPPAYALCAVFETNTLSGQPAEGRGPWQHPQGRHCFEMDLTVSPVYRPY